MLGQEIARCLVGEFALRVELVLRLADHDFGLLGDALVLWPTVYLDRATAALCANGEPRLSFLSPLGWEHINLTGDYLWRRDRPCGDF